MGGGPGKYRDSRQVYAVETGGCGDRMYMRGATGPAESNASEGAAGARQLGSARGMYGGRTRGRVGTDAELTSDSNSGRGGEPQRGGPRGFRPRVHTDARRVGRGGSHSARMRVYGVENAYQVGWNRVQWIQSGIRGPLRGASDSRATRRGMEVARAGHPTQCNGATGRSSPLEARRRARNAAANPCSNSSDQRDRPSLEDRTRVGGGGEGWPGAHPYLNH